MNAFDRRFKGRYPTRRIFFLNHVAGLVICLTYPTGTNPARATPSTSLFHFYLLVKGRAWGHPKYEVLE